MTDKIIDEVMGLVEKYGVECGEDGLRVKKDFYESAIRAKLREVLERKPMTEIEMENLVLKHAPPIHPDFLDKDDHEELIRAVEHFHNIGAE